MTSEKIDEILETSLDLAMVGNIFSTCSENVQ